MSHFRLLALDLDGTILRDDKTISETTKYWVRKTVQSGVTVSFATGRGVQNSECYRKELGLDSPMVLLNGAEIWASPDVLLERHFIDRGDIERLFKIAVETDSWFWGYCVEGQTRKQEWTDSMFKQDWMKFGLINNDLMMIEEIKAAIDGWESLEITQSHYNNLECMAKGISKEYGIRKVCDLLNIRMDQIMAIGDSFNDLKLLHSAGLGIAMGNAHEEIIRSANFVTADNESDGVAKAICKHIFEKV